MRKMERSDEERRKMCACCADAGGTVTPCSVCEWGSLCPAYDGEDEMKDE